MDDKTSLKDSREKERVFDTSDRFRYLDAVEWATGHIIRELRNYVARHKTGPKVIAVRTEWYQQSPCIQGLISEVQRLGLASKVIESNNGTSGDLNFDLDNLADQYLSTRDMSPLPPDSSSSGCSYPYFLNDECAYKPVHLNFGDEESLR